MAAGVLILLPALSGNYELIRLLTGYALLPRMMGSLLARYGFGLSHLLDAENCCLAHWLSCLNCKAKVSAKNLFGKDLV